LTLFAYQTKALAAERPCWPINSKASDDVDDLFVEAMMNSSKSLPEEKQGEHQHPHQSKRRKGRG